MNPQHISPSQNIPDGVASNVVPLHPLPSDNAARFARYVEPLIPLIRKRVAYLTLAGDDVDDNLQEVLIHLYLCVHRYNPDEAFPITWINRVVTNKMLHLNRRPAEPPVVIPITDPAPTSATEDHPAAEENAAPDAEAEAPDDDAVPDPCRLFPRDAAELKAHYPLAHGALRRLEPRDRRIIILHAEGWPVREIAEHLHLTPAAVSQRIFRLKTRLRESLLHIIERRRRTLRRMDRP